MSDSKSQLRLSKVAPEAFFRRILKQVGEAYDRSPVKRKFGSEGWFYSVCALPLKPGKNLLIGLNWGVDSKSPHRPQEAPDGPEEVARWRFIQTASGCLQTYLPTSEDKRPDDLVHYLMTLADYGDTQVLNFLCLDL